MCPSLHSFTALLSKLKSARLALAGFVMGCAVAFSPCSAQTASLGTSISILKISVKDKSDAPVAGAVLMLEPSDGRSMSSRINKRDIAVDQVDREFVPKTTLTSVGARLSFPNRDVVQHSVYSFSKAKTFEIPIYAGESPQVLTLDKAGVITLGCNIHDWMLGYVVVVDTPIAELSKADGIVTLTDMPKGKYTVRVWHPHAKPVEHMQAIELTEAEQRVDIRLELATPRARYKPPLKLKSY
jgi:plastocyanin